MEESVLSQEVYTAVPTHIVEGMEAISDPRDGLRDAEELDDMQIYGEFPSVTHNSNDGIVEHHQK